MKEENGLDAELLFPLAIIRTMLVAPSEGKVDYFLVIYQASVIGSVLGPLDKKEIDDVRLAKVDEIESMVSRQEFPSIHPQIDPYIVGCLREVFHRTS